MNRTVIALVALMGVVSIWTSWAIASRWGLLQSPLGPMDLMMLRFTFAAAVMLPLIVRRGLGGISIGNCFVLGGLAGPLYTSFTYTGLVYAPAAHGAALTAGLLPLFTIGIGTVLGITKLGPARIVGLGLMMLATVAFFVDGHSADHPDAWFGDCLLIVGPLLWSIYTLRVQSMQMDAIRATAIVSCFGFLIFAPIYALFGDPSGLSEAGLSGCLMHGIFQGWVVVVGSLTLYTYCVRSLGPAVTTLATAAVPGMTAIAAAFVLDEPLSGVTTIGVALNAAGLIAVAYALKRRREPLRPVPVGSMVDLPQTSPVICPKA